RESPAAPPPGRPRDPGRLGRAIARNTLWTIGARLVFLLGWALITPWMLKSLGPDRFAVWALLFALSGYFATFDLGLSQALVRFVAEFAARGDVRALRGLVTLAALLYSVLAALGVAALALAQGPLLALVHTPESLRAEAAWAAIAMA